MQIFTHVTTFPTLIVCHAHTPYGKAFAALGKPLDIITQDGCMFYNDLAHYNDFGGAALESDEGIRIANALGNKKAGILQNHGLITVGKSIESAVLWFIAYVSAHSPLTSHSEHGPDCDHLRIIPISTGLNKNARSSYWPMQLLVLSTRQQRRSHQKMHNSPTTQRAPRRPAISLLRSVLYNELYPLSS